MLTQRLAEFVIDTRTADIPQQVMDGARDALIDTLGCGLAGTLEETGEIALRFARECGGNPHATVWAHAFSTSAPDAAFVNGIASHALDFDDTHVSVRGHPSPTLIPAIIAAGEYAHASGADALAAHAVGLEVGGKIGRALGDAHYMRGWHATATVGVFSCTAAATRLLRLSSEQLRMAFGIAASQLSGLVRNFGTMTKPFHAGHAAKCGVISAMMARQGFTADASIFDGKDSLFKTYAGEDAQPLAQLLERLASPWEMLEPGIGYKRWPCCYCNHRSIGGLLQMLKQHAIKPDEVEAVEIGFPPGSDTALISSDPQTGLQGKFSIEYVAAATLLDGKIGLESFTDVMVQRPEVRQLMQKVKRYRIDIPGIFSGTTGYNDLAVKTTRGEFKQHIDKTPGSPAWPITAADRDEKFLDCAGRVLGDRGAQTLLVLANGCQQLADISELARATVPAGAAVRAAAPSGKKTLSERA